MLRRKPTAITLTTEDVAIYEDTRAREAMAREQVARQAQMQSLKGTPTQQKNSQNRDPKEELKPLSGDRVRAAQVKTREERLGIGGSSRS